MEVITPEAIFDAHKHTRDWRIHERARRRSVDRSTGECRLRLIRTTCARARTSHICDSAWRAKRKREWVRCPPHTHTHEHTQFAVPCVCGRRRTADRLGAKKSHVLRHNRWVLSALIGVYTRIQSNDVDFCCLHSYECFWALLRLLAVWTYYWRLMPNIRKVLKRFSNTVDNFLYLYLYLFVKWMHHGTRTWSITVFREVQIDHIVIL